MCPKQLTWLISSLLIVFFPLSGFNQTNPEEIVDQLIMKRAGFESVHYHINFRTKLLSRPDTLDFVANVELVRKPEDTLFHGLVLIKMDTAWYGYDGEKIFGRFLNTNEVIYDNALTSPGLFIKSSVKNNLVDDGFLKINTGLKKVISNPEYNPSFVDTTLDGIQCLGIFFSTPDAEEFTNYRYFVAIDINSSSFKKIMYSVYFQGNEQYQEWNYSDMKFGHESNIPNLDFKTFGGNIKETHYTSSISYKSDVPDFEWSSLKGKLYNSEEWVSLKNIRTKYIILDFWYSSCYPCIKSIPAVSEISSKYDTSEVKVFGVNMIDDEVKSKSRLEQFFVNNPMPYPTIMLDQSYGKKLPLAFPTFIILNDHYEVIYQEVGFKETLFDEVTAFLDKRLKQ